MILAPRPLDGTPAPAPMLARRAREPCAAPHPSLARTGAPNTCSLPCEEDGPRAPIGFEVTEDTRTALCQRRLGGESTSRRVWCRHVPVVPADGNQVRPRSWMPTVASIHPAEKKQAIRFEGEFVP